MRKYLFLVTCILSNIAANSANAAYYISMEEVGPDVFSSGSGTLNLSGLQFLYTGDSNSVGIRPNLAVWVSSRGMTDVYLGMTGPNDFGAGDVTFSTIGTGPSIVMGYDQKLWLPEGYVSGELLSPTTLTLSNASFASLGIMPGTYTWSWGNGVDGDSIVMRIGTAAVPEPATWAMMLVGFGAIGFGMRRRQRQTVRYNFA